MRSSYDILREDLAKIGVRPGDTLVVHSSMKSMGYVDGGPECVIAALTDALGEAGTLMFPTFTFDTSYKDSFYSNKDTPSCVGLLSETFRKQEGVYRTNHPTHSVALRGRLVEVLTEGELLDDTPMGIHSPYRKLAALGAKILMLGCTMSHNSFMHALEEDAGVEYALRGHQTYTVVDADGNTFFRSIRRHNFARPERSIAQRYDRTLSVLEEGDYRQGEIHGAAAVLLDCAVLKKKALQKMKADPTYFIDDPSGVYAAGCKTNL